MTEHKTTSKSKFCLECGKPMKQNEKEEWFCPSCGYKLEKKTSHKEVEQPQKEKSNTFAICCGGAIVFFIIIMIIGSLNDSGNYSSSKTSDKGVYCTVFRSSSGIVAPYDSSCRPCGDGHTHFTCSVSDSFESGMNGAFELCKGYCTPN